MKSYLSLIPVSAKVRKKQNRMTILCIMAAVFLVTAVFSVADMMIRTESGFMLSKHGNWHIQLKNISENIENEICRREDVSAAGNVSVFNLNGEQPYRVNEKRTALYGADKTYMEEISNGISEGCFPKNDQEVLLSPNASDALLVQVGDTVTLRTPSGEKVFIVSGFGTDDRSYYENQTFLVGMYMTQESFASVMKENGNTEIKTSFCIQFENAAKAAEAVPELQSKYQISEEDISENTGVMGISGQSDSEAMKNIYGLAFLLFILVLMAGVLMISGSMNSNVVQRTQFFGMMRCIGASREQVIRFVRLEALNWCKLAVPLGIFAGVLASWGLCGTLRYGIGGEFDTMPVFSVSLVGIVCGAAVGIITVLLAAQAPAKRAARISPVSAVSGNTEMKASVYGGTRVGIKRIDCFLGVRHGVEKKKNWCFMTASFALAIVLTLSFSVIMDFAKLLMPSLNVTSADVVLTAYSNEMILDRGLVDEIKSIEEVRDAYGSSYLSDIPVTVSGAGADKINMVSYDSTLLDYAQGSVVQGSLEGVDGSGNKAATVFNRNNNLKKGDIVQIAGENIEISCVLSQGLFGDGQILICSQETFDRLMGKEKYGLIGVLLEKDAGNETVAQIRNLENDNIIITDQRESNRQDKATYWASRIICYGFLMMIGMITIFHIINSISMSVSARIRQYGVMRAVGMDNRQLCRMISVEALTYTCSGMLVGCAAGIFLNRFLYVRLITRYFGIPWRLPVFWLGVVGVFILISAAAAVYTPLKRIRNMSITETINEL